MKRRINPRCCRACNRPLIALADTAQLACPGCDDAGVRDVRGHPCGVCGVDDQRMLCERRLADGWTVLCANHAAVLGRRSLRLAELVHACGLLRPQRSA